MEFARKSAFIPIRLSVKITLGTIKVYGVKTVHFSCVEHSVVVKINSKLWREMASKLYDAINAYSKT